MRFRVKKRKESIYKILLSFAQNSSRYNTINERILLKQMFPLVYDLYISWGLQKLNFSAELAPKPGQPKSVVNDQDVKTVSIIQ